jgi:ubiquinone/menaquinone biosynthesis C-methylase UbiE/DNA-binding MarR family transcriptional regulator
MPSGSAAAPAAPEALAPAPDSSGIRALVGRLEALGDETRMRLLLLLDRGEMNVGELGRIVHLPLSSVSRHLKTLAEAGWVRFRSEGTSRVYRLSTPAEMPDRAVWRAVRDLSRGSRMALDDAERAEVVLSERRQRSREFFRSGAGAWDEIRTRHFGGRLDLLPVLGLLSETDVGDLGCGTGGLIQALAPAARTVVGVDREPEMLAAAASRLADAPNVTLRVGELEALPLDDRSLDVAFLVLVLHLIPDPRRVLSEAARVLRPGGRLIVLDLRDHDRDEFRSEMGHLWNGFSAETLLEWFDEVGLVRGQVYPLPPDPAASGPLLFMASALRVGPALDVRARDARSVAPSSSKP